MSVAKYFSILPLLALCKALMLGIQMQATREKPRQAVSACRQCGQPILVSGMPANFKQPQASTSVVCYNCGAIRNPTPIAVDKPQLQSTHVHHPRPSHSYPPSGLDGRPDSHSDIDITVIDLPAQGPVDPSSDWSSCWDCLVCDEDCCSGICGCFAFCCALCDSG